MEQRKPTYDINIKIHNEDNAPKHLCTKLRYFMACKNKPKNPRMRQGLHRITQFNSLEKCKLLNPIQMLCLGSLSRHLFSFFLLFLDTVVCISGVLLFLCLSAATSIFFPTPFEPILENAKMVFSTNLKGWLNQMKPTADKYFTKEGRKVYRVSKLGV